MCRRAAILLCGSLIADTAAAGPPELGLPIACDIGATCWVQQYFDRNPSPAARDYACGQQTYDGHDGTDFRVRDTNSRADVIASSAGTVTAVRDGDADRLARGNAGRTAVAGRECGNGVVIDHGAGWQTQYCHMRRGSVAVKPGDAVERGTRLGEVGFSGLAAFPHVHLTVRKDGKSIDPFAVAATTCGETAGHLWHGASPAPAYRKGEVIRVGFASGPVDLEALEMGTLPTEEPDATWPALVFYAWVINLGAGDTVAVTLRGPAGIAAENSAALDRSKAQYMLFAGKKRPEGGWPAGGYSGTVTIASGGVVRFTQEWRATIE